MVLYPTSVSTILSSFNTSSKQDCLQKRQHTRSDQFHLLNQAIILISLHLARQTGITKQMAQQTLKWTFTHEGGGRFIPPCDCHLSSNCWDDQIEQRILWQPETYLTLLPTQSEFCKPGFCSSSSSPDELRALRASSTDGTVSTCGSNCYGCIPYLPTAFSSKSSEAAHGSEDEDDITLRYLKVHRKQNILGSLNHPLIGLWTFRHRPRWQISNWVLRSLQHLKYLTQIFQTTNKFPRNH